MTGATGGAELRTRGLARGQVRRAVIPDPASGPVKRRLAVDTMFARNQVDKAATAARLVVEPRPCLGSGDSNGKRTTAAPPSLDAGPERRGAEQLLGQLRYAGLQIGTEGVPVDRHQRARTMRRCRRRWRSSFCKGGRDGFGHGGNGGLNRCDRASLLSRKMRSKNVGAGQPGKAAGPVEGFTPLSYALNSLNVAG